MPTARLVSITPNYKELLCTACGEPYGNNVSMKGVQKIIESGHLSILEHCYASFEIECSIRVLGQITRHRHLSFTVQSTRGHRIDKFYLPVEEEVVPLSEEINQSYDLALNTLTLEEAAYYAPQGAMTKMVVTGNFRAWREYLPKRMCQRAMKEHRELAGLIAGILEHEAPEIFAGIGPSCKTCNERSCSFIKEADKS